jgi:hypothetical protein
MSAVAVADTPALGFPTLGQDSIDDEVDSCLSCGHPESAHELLLTSTISWVICHESTESGECYRVRHSEGIPFGACRRDPA